MRPEETIDFHIRSTWSKLSKAYNSAAAAHGGTIAMAYTLLNVDKEGTLSTRLGPKMGMEPTGMSRLLKTLDDEGYIMRKPDKADKRKVWIHLTPKGKKYRDITKQYVIALNKHMQAIIPPDDLATFFRVIDHINNELDRVKIAY